MANPVARRSTHAIAPVHLTANNYTVYDFEKVAERMFIGIQNLYEVYSLVTSPFIGSTDC